MNFVARVAALALAFAATAAGAQGYPSKPVRVIVPYPAGGIVEIIARAVLEKVAANWNNPVIVEAKPGANGSIGTDAVAKSAADGHTWLLATLSHTTNPSLQKNVPWHPTNDFAGAAMLATVPALAVVPASLPAKSLKEFVALAKSQPGKLNYLMPGTGTSMHLNSELLKLTAGIDLVAVPYKGLPPAVPDLLSGALSFGLLSLPLAAPHVKAGKLRALAIASPTRSAQFPDVPTFAEAGFPDAQVVSWFAILLPAKTPRAIVAHVNQELDKALRDPEVVRRLENAGANVAAPMKAEEIDTMLKQEVARWAKFVKDARIEAQ
jgi:tripartite-type tricarboxylate transporter receptor subunit TctC